MPSVGIREFRSDLAGYIDRAVPVEVTRRGQVVGIFVPTAKRQPFDAAQFAASSERLDDALHQAHVDIDGLVRDFDDARRGAVWR